MGQAIPLIQNSRGASSIAMKQTRIIMGMPITVELDQLASEDVLESVFDYFRQVDARYSTYKSDSEISQINRGLPRRRWSDEMKTVLDLCEDTRRQTKGYFNIEHQGHLDPSGLVKGWAIQNAAKLLRDRGVRNFYIEAGGDIQARGHNAAGAAWQVGIRNPFASEEIIKVLRIHSQGVATSGTYIRGEHIYDPHHDEHVVHSVKSLTVVGPNIYEADRFATAAFAMGTDGITFIERQPGLEGYMVDQNRMATYTSGFDKYVE